MKSQNIIRLIFGILTIIIPRAIFAQTNIAPSATASASTCNTGACSTLNDLNFGTCGTQQMWISTSTPPSTVPGDNYIQWDWSTPQTFDALIIHHAQTGTRFLAGALVQNWNGSAWVDVFNFSNLPNSNCINTVPFPAPLTTSRFRITSFLMSGNQLSNPNFREIEIIEAQAPNLPKDPPSPNFQFTLGLDTLWEKSISTIVNTSTDAAKSYWNITQYSASSSTGPYSNYSTLPKDTLQCNTWGCFIDTAQNNPNLSYSFPTRGFYKVSLTAVNQFGSNTIEKVVFVDTPATKPTALFFATRRQTGTNDRIQLNNLSSNAPARVKWWMKNACTSCPVDSNLFLPSDSAFNPVIAAFNSGTYSVCVEVSNSKGVDTFCRTNYIRILPGYLMCHSETGRADSVGRDNEGYIYSDLRDATGKQLSGEFQPSACASSGFRIAPCADTIYISLERLRLRPGSFSGPGDSLYVRLNGFNGPILRRFGGNNLSILKDTIRTFKYAGEQLFINYTPAAGTPPPVVKDSGFAIRWTSFASNLSKPTADFTSPDTLYSGYSVRFINKSKGDRMSFAWDLNDDGIYGMENPGVKIDSITPNPKITYTTTTPDSVMICLKAINCAGYNINCKTLPIFPITLAPTAEFTVNRTSGFVSDTFRLIDKSMNGALSWRWRFEPNNVTYLEGTDSTSQFPVISLNAAQYYDITLIVANQLGNSSISKNQLIHAIDYNSPNSAFPPVQDITDFGISRVVIKGADNTIDTITPLKTPTYTRLYNTLETNIYRGGTYSIDVYRSTANDPMSVRIWADFNRDADYMDENETLLSENNTKTVKTGTTFTIPANAQIGTSRILVGACNSISSISPISATIGVYEDYGIYIGNDAIKPVITLNGPANITAELNNPYNDLGANAMDNIQGDISNSIQTIHNIDITQLGYYTIKYFVTDMYGNTSDTVIRNVHIVINNNGPKLTLIGNDTMSVEVYSDFTEPGYSAYSNLNIDITAQVQRTGTVDTRIVGNYTLEYSITDAYGMKAEKKRLVQVVDIQKPVVSSFSGKDTVVHQIGTAFDDGKYVQVTDNYWNNMLPVRISGSINSSKVGSYTLTYRNTDGSGNVSDEFVLTVEVRNTIKPTIQLVGSEVVTIPVYGSYNDLGVVAKDYKGELLTWVSDLNEKLRLDTIWEADITYTATDEYGDMASIQRKIRVRDMESPVIELQGNNPFVHSLGKPYVDPGVKVTDNFDAAVFTQVNKEDNIGIQVSIDVSKLNVNGAGFYYTVYIHAEDANGNKAEEKKRLVYVPLTGLNDVAANGGFSVYPNPANQELHIVLEKGEIANLSTFDVQGKEIKLTLIKDGEKNTADISNIPTGLYILRLETKEGLIQIGKFSIIR